MKVAIDGPAGAGKSSVARAVADRLGFLYVDTGALYRAAALFAIRRGVAPGDAEHVLPLLAEMRPELCYQDGEQRVLLNGENVSALIRTEEVSRGASAISAIPEVREFLFRLQRDIAEQNDVVMDGRDIGTVVLPDAEVKIFLTAEPEIRAKRRMLQLAEEGVRAEYEDVLADVRQRDWNDSHRAAAPLKMADGAVLLDSSFLGERETALRVAEIVKRAADAEP
ncbi:MAG TPA: (d)CMP kinase [Oscillospiraceae bacterium]|nr:(d)CMP kinase [Oscillospiraceae bacterium]HNW04582.1 (d)CMP kinase [Oscillospiraceae bacterium]HPW00632.1 (d)CMP kinase [Oscillospiraceae bacterium]